MIARLYTRGIVCFYKKYKLESNNLNTKKYRYKMYNLNIDINITLTIYLYGDAQGIE